MKLISPAFTHNQPIPASYTCKGENVSPPLAIVDAPANTKAFVLILHDPDAVSGDFAHWLLWNIPSTTTQIAAGDAPAQAVQGKNDFGKPGYGGPCPPSGTGVHRYTFDLYALDEALEAGPEISRTELETVFEAHTLAHAQLIGLFEVSPQ